MGNETKRNEWTGRCTLFHVSLLYCLPSSIDMWMPTKLRERERQEENRRISIGNVWIGMHTVQLISIEIKALWLCKNRWPIHKKHSISFFNSSLPKPNKRIVGWTHSFIWNCEIVDSLFIRRTTSFVELHCEITIDQF